MLKSTISNLLTALTIVISSCISLSTTAARQLEPILDSADESANTGKDAQSPNIASIYKLTQAARTTNDFTQIVHHCHRRLADNSIDEKDRQYLKSLLSWALNRRGEKQLAAAEVLESVANYVESQKSMDRAIADFEESFESDPTRWRALMGRANAYAMNREFDKAIEAYTRVNKLNPRYWNAVFNRAEMYFAQKNYDAALKDYRRIVHEDQTDVQAITGCALCYCAKEKYEQAVAEFKSVIRLQPANAAAFCNLGDALQMTGEYSKAYERYNEATECANPGIAYQRVAQLLATCPTKKLHQPQTALDLANRAIQMDGETPRNLETLATVLAATGDHQLASETKQRAEDAQKQLDAERGAVRIASDPNPTRLKK